MSATLDQLPVTLIDLLANTVVLRQLAPYIPIRSLLDLSATSKYVRDIIVSQTEPWRHLDLTRVKSAIIDSSPIDVGGISWRAERMDESLTEDDFYSGPLRGIFGRLHQKHMLRNVQTLVLDGLSVPADLVHDIVTDATGRYNVRILSLRESKHLNLAKLQHVLRYICRPTRSEGTPKLRGLYVFGSKDDLGIVKRLHLEVKPPTSLGVLSSEGAQIGAEWNRRSSTALEEQMCDGQAKWYNSMGRVMKRPLSDWPETILACKGLVNFDAVLCRGPKHDITKVDSHDFLQPTVATIALGFGCETCGSCPEQPAKFGVTPEHTLPLLSPPPTHSSSLRAAQMPHSASQTLPPLFVRCEDCLRGRWCERCNRWWCEDCYIDPINNSHLRTELQQVELRDGLQRRDGAAGAAFNVKVAMKLCVEHCLVSEMMAGAGSNGMWG